MSFNGLTLTNKGEELLQSMLQGHEVEFKEIRLGDGAKPTNIKSLDNLVQTKQTIAISRVTKVTQNVVTVGGNLLGSDVQEAFNFKEIGIFAKDKTINGDLVLFSYDYDETPSHIDRGGSVTEMLIDFNIKVSDSNNVTVEVSGSNLLSTKEEVEHKIDELRSEIGLSIDTLNLALDDHSTDYENPHSVTKEQIGLNNVKNYGIASVHEAENATTNEKYMTPARTLNTIKSKAVQSDNNNEVIIKIQSSQPSPQSGKTIIWIDTNS